jgi:hypothetical protein
MLSAVAQAQRPDAALSRETRTARLAELAQGSEILLDLFEQLSGHYESSMQMLVG